MEKTKKLKKISWFISVFTLCITAIVIQWLPQKVPMHFDIEGNIDRWGSRNEEFIFPIIILALNLHWHLFISHFEKKAGREKEEKQKQEAINNAKVVAIVSVCQMIMFSGMHFFMLYNDMVSKQDLTTKWVVDLNKVSLIFAGIVFIVIANFITKTKNNNVVGFRFKYSMYNENTWRKSNRFAAIVMMIIGVLVILTTAVFTTKAAVILLVISLIAGTILTGWYSKKVYDKEINAKKELRNSNKE